MSPFSEPNGPEFALCVLLIVLGCVLVAWALSFRFERRADRGEFKHQATVRRVREGARQ